MQNITTRIDGNKHIIEIKLDASGAAPSASGKTRLIVRTRGSIKIANPKLDNLSQSSNAYMPNR